MASEPRPAAPADPETAKLLKVIAQQRCARTTTPRGRIALDDLAEQIVARQARLAEGRAP